MKPAKIHVTGASGTGTTTLGRALAQRTGWPAIDADDFFWEPTDPKFSTKRAPAERDALLSAELESHAAWILTGSIKGWELAQVAEFGLVVYLSVPTDVRLRRLRARELAEFGAERLGPGGDMETIHTEFLEWAARYDTAGLEQRSRVSLAAWLARIDRPVLRIEGDVTTEVRLTAVLDRLGQRH